MPTLHYSYDDARAHIQLVALREEPHTGVFIQVGLAFAQRPGQWMEVTDKEVTPIESFSPEIYQAIRPARNVTVAGLPISDELGLATCPACQLNKSSWCTHTATATLCHSCTVADCGELRFS